ncbi:MarR family winged helix-turn-helix transcriptional regulator [Rathayibacter sp. YIM 133350]|uniref:MarR family winged helix-turn-helix transcriptional regulator n=1 Tax=Rathayibacter sp. YIM 133350 TaxID=3131992 RepID=UPI00307FA2D9
MAVESPGTVQHDGEGRRAEAIGEVIEGVAVLERDLAATRRVPFAGLVLGRSQLEVLFALAHGGGPITPGALAARLGVTAGAMTQILEALQAFGLVDSAPNPNDARSRHIVLTASARAEVVRFERDYVKALSPRFAVLDDGELSTLAHLLRRLKETPWTHPPSS